MNRDYFLTPQALKTETAKLADGNVCKLRELSAGQRLEFDGELDSKSIINKLLAYSLVDDDGVRLFTVEEIPKVLNNMRMDDVETLTAKIEELNGIGGSEKN